MRPMRSMRSMPPDYAAAGRVQGIFLVAMPILQAHGGHRCQASYPLAIKLPCCKCERYMYDHSVRVRVVHIGYGYGYEKPLFYLRTPRLPQERHA